MPVSTLVEISITLKGNNNFVAEKLSSTGSLTDEGVHTNNAPDVSFVSDTPCRITFDNVDFFGVPHLVLRRAGVPHILHIRLTGEAETWYDVEPLRAMIETKGTGDPNPIIQP